MIIPASTNTKFSVWKSENSMIVSWLIRSIIFDVSDHFILYATVAEIWSAAKKMYSKKDNASELYEFETASRN